ncbi:hypothetical protein GGX14DRAFT_566924 [Mycena pura]|uniref:Zn(2)-C6 fungal-type domain-containing protein n=1 Tax=Mycena pura TaxID=153505 RepID=A0AAD6VF98_9AGAR|nr:hypothetical protein GGX14DRAFT_566924 [Mycena pura]
MSSTAAPTSRHTTPEAIDGQEDDLGLQFAPAPSLMALVPRSGRSAPVRARESHSLLLLDDYDDSPPLSPVLTTSQPAEESAMSSFAAPSLVATPALPSRLFVPNGLLGAVTPRQEGLSPTQNLGDESAPDDQDTPSEPSFVLRPIPAAAERSLTPTHAATPRSPFAAFSTSPGLSLDEQWRLRKVENGSPLPSSGPSPGAVSIPVSPPDISIWRPRVPHNLEAIYDHHWHIRDWDSLPLAWIPLEIWLAHLDRWETALDLIRRMSAFLAENNEDLKPQLGRDAYGGRRIFRFPKPPRAPTAPVPFRPTSPSPPALPQESYTFTTGDSASFSIERSLSPMDFSSLIPHPSLSVGTHRPDESIISPEVAAQRDAVAAANVQRVLGTAASVAPPPASLVLPTIQAPAVTEVKSKAGRKPKGSSTKAVKKSAPPVLPSKRTRSGAVFMDHVLIEGPPRGHKRDETSNVTKRKAPEAGDEDKPPKRRRKMPVVTMAGPIPLHDDPHRKRNNPERFKETTAVPPIDVDGLARAARHLANSEHGGCERCQFRRLKCDQPSVGAACSPCKKIKQVCPNTMSVEERMLLTNFLGSRLGVLSNERLNELIGRVNFVGDQMMLALSLARTIHSSYLATRAALVKTLEDLLVHYGDASGVAHAAEVAPAQREEFCELLRFATQIMGSLPTLPENYQPISLPRSSWDREAFAPYRALDEELEQALRSRPGGDSGQGSSRRPARETAARTPTPSAVPSDEAWAPNAPGPTVAERAERSPSPKLSKAEGKRKVN